MDKKRPSRAVRKWRRQTHAGREQLVWEEAELSDELVDKLREICDDFDDPTGEFHRNLVKIVSRYKEDKRIQRMMPTASAEKADVEYLLQALAEVRFRIERMPPKIDIFALIAAKKTGKNWDNVTDNLLNAIREVRNLVGLALQRLAQEPQQTNPGKAPRDGLIVRTVHLYRSIYGETEGLPDKLNFLLEDLQKCAVGEEPLDDIAIARTLRDAEKNTV